MRKLFVALMCAGVLLCGTYGSAMSETTSSPQLVGKHWMESTQNEKLAFLYGVSSMIAIEHVSAQKEGKEPTLFVKQWMKTFKDADWKSIQNKLDDWYASHPGESGRPVFDVLWYEFMAPKTGK